MYIYIDTDIQIYTYIYIHIYATDAFGTPAEFMVEVPAKAVWHSCPSVPALAGTYTLETSRPPTQFTTPVCLTL